MSKTLIVSPSWIGDAVLSHPLLARLKQADPTGEIGVLAPPWVLPVYKRMPEVGATHALAFGHGELRLGERRRFAKTLPRYDRAVVLPNTLKSALIPWFARIPVRTGWRGEMRYGLLNDCRILDKKRYPLMIERFMALGIQPDEIIPVSYPIPSLQTSHDEQTKALLIHQLSMSTPALALCPGAEFGPAKRWPEEYYAEVAKVKIAEGWQVWIFGSP